MFKKGDKVRKTHHLNLPGDLSYCNTLKDGQIYTVRRFIPFNHKENYYKLNCITIDECTQGFWYAASCFVPITKKKLRVNLP